MKSHLIVFQIWEMLFGVAVSAFGIALMIKSTLGQTAATAFTQNLASILHLRSGTALAGFLCLCILFQLLIQRADFEWIQLFQFFIAWMQGKIVNLVCYDVPLTRNLLPKNYVQAWEFMIAGILLCSMGVAILMTAELLRNPFEQLVMVIAHKIGIKFSKLRVWADICLMISSLIIILGWHLDFTTLREGTWLSMVLLGHSMAYTFPLARRWSRYQRYRQRIS